MANKKFDLFTILFLILFLAVGIYSLIFTVEAISIRTPAKSTSNKQLILNKSDFQKMTEPTLNSWTISDPEFSKNDPFAKIGQAN